MKSAAICVALLCLIVPTHASIIPVTNTNDSGAGSLRQALAIANNGDTIDATGISGVITLTTGELLVDKSVIINGAGADLLAVDGNATSRVFQIGTGETVTISALTIRNCQGGFGGGILNGAAATLTITNSTLSSNTAGFGGGTYNAGTLTIVNSTVSGNTANEGAGTYNATTLTIINSTISGNAAAAGGASFNNGALEIANSTLSDNSADIGGGVVNLGAFHIGNTILNRGDSGENIYSNGGATITSLGYNLSSDDGGGFLTGPGDQVNTDPLLGPLQDNGGPTFTHALLPSSPAINAGNPSFTPPPFFDQRGPGFDRVVNSRIDKGSFEVQGPTPTPTPTPTATPTATATASATATATATSSATPTVTPTATPTPTATSTPAITPIPTSTPTPTLTPRPTPSPRPSPLPRSRPTPAPRPMGGLISGRTD